MERDIRSPEYYINKEYIEKKDNVRLHTLQLVSELFNKGYNGNQHNYFRASNNNDNIRVWCPKIKLNIGDHGNVPFDNVISEDGKYIYESRKENNDQFLREQVKKEQEIRYTFPYFKDETGEYFYKYFGIYKFNKELSKKENKRVWVKEGDCLDLTQFFKAGKK